MSAALLAASSLCVGPLCVCRRRLHAARQAGGDRPKETTEVIISTIGVGLVVAERRSGTWQGRIGGVARDSPGGTFRPTGPGVMATGLLAGARYDRISSTGSSPSPSTTCSSE